MSSAPSGSFGRPSAAIAAWENEGGVLVAPPCQAPPPRQAAPRTPAALRHIVRSGKRTEDTAAGCRANAASDLLRADAPGGDFMRLRLEHSAAVWTERADLLERLEKKSRLRAGAA